MRKVKHFLQHHSVFNLMNKYAQEFTEGFFLDDTYVELTKYNENVFLKQ